MRGQAEAMQAQVASYLNRARIAAQRDTVLARTDVQPVLERLVRVMRRLNPDTMFELKIAVPDATLAMEQQDVEETIGNLLENAARFARSRITIDVSPASPPDGAGEAGRRRFLEVVIEDDGPGLEPEQIVEALKRGRRLDESRRAPGLAFRSSRKSLRNIRAVLRFRAGLAVD